MRTILALLALTASTTLQAGEDWPQFRGPQGQGHSDATGLPLVWSETEHVKWKTPIPGEGWSSPVILGNQVWMTTATDEGRSLRAVCVDRQTGKLVHNVEVFHRDDAIVKHETNSFASPTPILEGDRVYVDFGTMGVACLEATTGNIVWQSQEFKLDHECGPGSSPALYGDLLLFNCDGTDVQFGAALDKNTGALAWKTKRSGVIDKPNDRKKAFVTPLVINDGQRDLVIMTGAEWVYAYDPRTGEEVWNIKHPGFSVAPRPIYADGILYVATGYMLPELFAIRPQGKGDITATNVVWKIKQGVPAKPSPLLVDDALYLVNDPGVITCVDAKTGKQYWRQRVAGPFSASPIFADGRIYACSEKGTTLVFAPNKERFEELASNQLEGRFMASPAIVGKSLFLRTDTHLYRIEE